MHDDQISLDLDTARRLIHDQFPQYRRERIRPQPATGTVNAIVRIGSFAAARFPLRRSDPAEAADALRRETLAMDEFAGTCPFPAPRRIGLGRPAIGYPLPWGVQTWIDGDVATPGGLSASRTFALDLAHLVASLREATVRGRRFDGRGRGGHLAAHDGWMATCFEKSERHLDVVRLRRMWTRFRELPPAVRHVMSHKDLIPANLLVEGERLVGVLDTGDFGPADPALDLVGAWHLLDRERRTIFRTRLGPDEIEWKRGAAWAFEQAMGLVWYYSRTHRRMSALGRSTLDRILDDPDL